MQGTSTAIASLIHSPFRNRFRGRRRKKTSNVHLFHYNSLIETTIQKMENVKWPIKGLQQERVHLGANIKWEKLPERNTEGCTCCTSSNTSSVLRDDHARGWRPTAAPQSSQRFDCADRNFGWSSSNSGWHSHTTHSALGYCMLFRARLCARAGGSRRDEAQTVFSQISQIHDERKGKGLISILQRNALKRCDKSNLLGPDRWVSISQMN